MTVYLPLKGVRVLSFELAFALPAGTRVLSDLGAEVVRVARPGGNPYSRYISAVDGVFHGKPCIDIDLKTARGKQLALDLALEADVVSNNYRPGVLDKFGLGSDRLRKAKPELIWMQLSGYGTPGPWSTFPAYGPSTEAAGGLNRLFVNEEEVPIRVGSGVFSDQLSGRYAALAIVAALEKRCETGEGATIDLSMTECITHMLGSLMVQAATTGSVPSAEGNRHSRYVPQGVYPCAGVDQWLAISIGTQQTWEQLVDIVADARLNNAMTIAERRASHDDIDAIIRQWTMGRDKDVLADLLQRHGIAAAPVRTVQDSALDPQFKARGSLQQIRHSQPVMGYRSHPQPPLPWRIIGRKRKTLTDYRNNGRDNEKVLGRWLGYDAAQVKELVKSGVMSVSRSRSLDNRLWASSLNDPDFASKLGLKN
jgi:crotonobetainyl-CoA:carnitine CoA-transferase CaiB-like acyl-CoA transferase|tara:strand:- start:18825 stop:20096 length:1272 start_codon:yes stop_codon:yes gene_type:complete